MRIIDYGNCPQNYVSGLARIDLLGANARFVFFDLRPPRPGEENTCGLVGEVTSAIVAPCDTVEKAVRMMVTTFGIFPKGWATAPSRKYRM